MSSRLSPQRLMDAWEKVGGVGHVLPLEDLAARINALAHDNGARTAAVGESAMLAQSGCREALAQAGIEIIAPFQPLGEPLARAVGVDTNRDSYLERLAEADLGISEAMYAIVETGTLVLFDRCGLGDPVSLLPPVHVAIVREERIVETLEDLLPVLTARAGVMLSPGNSLVLMTGPSRTADIEQTLVVGVHGPRQAHLIVVT